MAKGIDRPDDRTSAAVHSISWRGGDQLPGLFQKGLGISVIHPRIIHTRRFQRDQRGLRFVGLIQLPVRSPDDIFAFLNAYFAGAC